MIPSLNQGQYLHQALDSLFEQRDDALEVVLVDGGSRDESLEIIRQNAGRLAWWVSEPDAGQSDAINKGFAKSRGRWLSWLNSDDVLLPGALRQLRRLIDSTPDARWFAGGGCFIDTSGRHVREYPPPPHRMRAADLVPWTQTWFGQPGTFFRRDLLEEVGGSLRTDLRYAMDLELWLRLGRASDLVPIPAAVGAYRLHGESKTVAERHAMECEVVQVLWEQMGQEAAMRRVAVLAKDRFELEARLVRLSADLRSPAGWARLLRRRLAADAGEKQG